MNSDFHCQKIKVIQSNNLDLITEWNTVMLDKKALEEGYRKEADKYHNDACDAALYGFSIAKHYMNKTPLPIDDRSPMRKQTEENYTKRIDQQKYYPSNNYEMNIYDEMDIIGMK